MFPHLNSFYSKDSVSTISKFKKEWFLRKMFAEILHVKNALICKLKSLAILTFVHDRRNAFCSRTKSHESHEKCPCAVHPVLMT